MEGEQLQEVETEEIDQNAQMDLDTEGVEEVEGQEIEEGAEVEEGGEPAKVEFSEAQQVVFNEAMNKKTAGTYKEKQRADGLQAQIDAINAAKPQPQRPVIPEIPDQFAENIQELHATRDAAIAAAAKFDADAVSASHKITGDNAAAEQQAIDAVNVVTADYASRSVNLGIKDTDLQQAGVTVAQSGINADIVGHIVKQPNGPQITIYLSKNPAELEALNLMNPMDAAVHINSVIIAKASKSGTAPAIPNPARAISGKGAAEGEGGPEGATYA